MKRYRLTLLITLYVLAPLAATAAINVSITEVNADLVVEYSGSVNLGSASPDTTGVNFSNNVIGTNGSITIKAGPVEDYFATYVSKPASFGTSGLTNGTESPTSDPFGFSVGSTFALIYLPDNYSSGSTISGGATFSNASLSDLGLSTGTYEWQFTVDGSGSSVPQSYMVTVVPEPSACAFIFGLLASAYAARRKSRR